jgi:cbb3-type cytochrome oxidase maturation protein
MSVIYIVLPLSLIFVVLAVSIFVWATQSGQFDDMETPGLRMLNDDEEAILKRRTKPTKSVD